MPFYLAVDSGGTKAEFLLADETREIKRVFSGAIRPINANTDAARQNIANTLAEIECAAGVPLSEVACACIGTSGSTLPLVVDFLREEFSHRLSCRLLILNDVEIALSAAFQDNRGALVLAGTGSNLAARCRDGSVFTVGGWGPILGDQGSGHWIGLEGLRRGLLARDTGRPTHLLTAARELFRLSDDDALLEFANAQHPVRFASRFAPAVISLAAEGDEVAIEILEQGGRDLAQIAGIVIKRMETVEGHAFAPPPIAVTGGILSHVVRLRQSMSLAIHKCYPGVEFLEAPVDPVNGALWRAIRGR